jgi:hypothetical protein
MAASLALFDPVIVHAAAAAAAIVLIAGAVEKLRDLELFRYAVENYRLLDSRAAAFFAPTFAGAELSAGVGLVFETTRPFAMWLALGVMALATGGVALNLLRGLDRIECGCGTGGQRISWGLVGRNAGLCVAIVLAAVRDLPRPLGSLDYFSVAGAVLALLALYASINQLLANQPLLKELQS